MVGNLSINFFAEPQPCLKPPRLLLGLLMGANRDFGFVRLDSLAIEIKPAILTLCGPDFFKSMRLIGGSDAETPKR